MLSKACGEGLKQFKKKYKFLSDWAKSNVNVKFLAKDLTLFVSN